MNFVTRDLAYPDQLVLWSVRRLVADPAGEEQVALELAAACGCRAGEALAALRALVDLLQGAGRRRFRLAGLAVERIGADELALVNAVAALQRGRAIHAAALFEWLMPREPAREALVAARSLARALAAAGHGLALRLAEPPSRRQAGTATRAVSVA